MYICMCIHLHYAMLAILSLNALLRVYVQRNRAANWSCAHIHEVVVGVYVRDDHEVSETSSLVRGDFPQYSI